MKLTRTFGVPAMISLIAVGALAALSTPADESREDWRDPSNPDPVAQSFRRDLEHEPGPGKPARRESIDQDELYRTINQPRWTTEAKTYRANSNDDIPNGDGDDEDTEN